MTQTVSSLNSQSKIRWDLLQRYKMIEIIALWEGRLTTNVLTNAFSISRQQASKDINTYNGILNPNQLEYDKTLKGYKPVKHFKPVFTQGITDEYLQLISNHSEISNVNTITLTNNEFPSMILKVPDSPHINPQMIHGLVTAVRQKKRIEVGYVSLRTPQPSKRIITPHTLIYSGFRWYVRAYCEKRNDFINFVLSRLRGEPELLGKAEYTISQDKFWNTPVTIEIIPDPRLSEEKQKIIEYDYGMQNKKLNIKTNAALVDYILKLLRIDPAVKTEYPEAQQIIVKNFKEIKDYLFPS